MRILVLYDICEARRLSRVAKVLKDYGHRVQKSKFEIETSKRGFAEMLERVSAEIDPEEDGVKYIPLCEGCRHKTEVIGLGRYIDPDQEYRVL